MDATRRPSEGLMAVETRPLSLQGVRRTATEGILAVSGRRCSARIGANWGPYRRSVASLGPCVSLQSNGFHPRLLTDVVSIHRSAPGPDGPATALLGPPCPRTALATAESSAGYPIDPRRSTSTIGHRTPHGGPTCPCRPIAIVFPVHRRAGPTRPADAAGGGAAERQGHRRRRWACPGLADCAAALFTLWGGSREGRSPSLASPRTPSAARGGNTRPKVSCLRRGGLPSSRTGPGTAPPPLPRDRRSATVESNK